MPGATGDTLSLLDGRSALVHTQVDFHKGGFLLGDGRVATTLSVPPLRTVGAREVILSIRGFYRDPEPPVGEASEQGLVLVPQEPKALEISGSQTLSGPVLASHIIVRRGSVVKVPSEQSLILTATSPEGILVEEGALIVGVDGRSAGGSSVIRAATTAGTTLPPPPPTARPGGPTRVEAAMPTPGARTAPAAARAVTPPRWPVTGVS